MPDTVVSFTGDKVALIVRGKTSAEHAPGKMEQHADCAKSDGAPVGYFGEDGAGSGYISSAVLFGIKGEVFDLAGFGKNRPYYVNLSLAQAYRVVSTVLSVTISNGEATKFDEYWSELTADPGRFSLLGRNCSTRASGAFRHAGILSGGIPGLDTPDNLYRQLVSERKDRCVSHSGHIGFEKAGNRFQIRIAEA